GRRLERWPAARGETAASSVDLLGGQPVADLVPGAGEEPVEAAATAQHVPVAVVEHGRRVELGDAGAGAELGDAHVVRVGRDPLREDLAQLHRVGVVGGVAGDQQVVAAPADQDVAAGAADDHVPPAAADQHVAA